MQSMDSAKSTLAVALADERLGQGWRRSRTRIRIVAVLCSLLAAVIVWALFDRFRVVPGDTKPPRELIAAVDLRIGNPAGAAERGEAKARADIEAGRLRLEVFGAPPAPARAKALKHPDGFAWINAGKEATPLTQAHAEAYNRVMQAEIERRHGREVLEQLMGERGLSLAQPKEGA